jgi:hypothetical protein
MSNISKSSIREWLVPPLLLPIFFVLLTAAAMLIQWESISVDPSHRGSLFGPLIPMSMMS